MAGDAPTPWFGEFALGIGEAKGWRIGPLHLVLQRNAHEWQAARTRDDDALADDLAVAQPERLSDLQRPDITRFGFRNAPGQIHLVPHLADRAMVVDTVRPFVLPPDEEVTLYLSSPLWLQIELDGTTVLDEAIFRPSDTWFGPDTQVGELCYASTTAARLELANLPQRPHRATTATIIRNRASTNLQIKSLKFPMPHLSLFANDAGRFWTETLVYEREHDDQVATVQLETDPPKLAGDVRRVATARETMHRSFLTRVFGGLLELGE